MLFLDELRKNDKKGLFKSSEVFTHYSTGFLPIDYLNAFKVDYFDEDGVGHKDLVPGVIGGRFITIVGYSGTGKTTLADQIGWSIVNDYDRHDPEAERAFREGALLFHYDIEQTALRSRISNITGTSPTEGRIIIQRETVAIEDVMEAIDKICKTKEANGDTFKYSIPGKWFGSNKPVKVYVPTVIILDSLPTFASREDKTEELEGQMSTNREVGQISQFYKKCILKMMKYNITVIAINHIKTKLKINMYEPDKPQLMLLKDGESLPRGQAPIYLASSLFRLNATGAKANQYTIEKEGFNGFKAFLQVTKTKTAYIGGMTPLCFNEKIGYDPIYTLFEFAYDRGLIGGQGQYLYFQGAEAYKFSRKNFREKFINDQMFGLAVMNALRPCFESLTTLHSMEDEQKDNTEYVDIRKLYEIDKDGNLVPTGIVEKDAELELKNRNEIILNDDKPGDPKDIIVAA